MEKDYRGSQKYTQEMIEGYDVPYVYRDICVDDYMAYLVCTRQTPRLIQNGIVYRIPFSSNFTRCGILKDQWKQCQEYRERELLEQMRKIYTESLKYQRAEEED